jgi:hypothetical protein
LVCVTLEPWYSLISDRTVICLRAAFLALFMRLKCGNVDRWKDSRRHGVSLIFLDYLVYACLKTSLSLMDASTSNLLTHLLKRFYKDASPKPNMRIELFHALNFVSNCSVTIRTNECTHASQTSSTVISLIAAIA